MAEKGDDNLSLPKGLLISLIILLHFIIEKIFFKFYMYIHIFDAYTCT